MNFVFPVTLLSKRIQFGQAIDLPQLFASIGSEVAAFKTWEESHPKLQLPGAERLELD
jgi:hypothetical protein